MTRWAPTSPTQGLLVYCAGPAVPPGLLVSLLVYRTPHRRRPRQAASARRPHTPKKAAYTPGRRPHTPERAPSTKLAYSRRFTERVYCSRRTLDCCRLLQTCCRFLQTNVDCCSLLWPAVACCSLL
jgi:hypothetical protein